MVLAVATRVELVFMPLVNVRIHACVPYRDGIGGYAWVIGCVIGNNVVVRRVLVEDNTNGCVLDLLGNERRVEGGGISTLFKDGVGSFVKGVKIKNGIGSCCGCVG